MELLELMKARHSVRQFTDRKIEAEARAGLENLMEQINRESGLHMQLITDEPKAFNGMMAHYGKFQNCRNYIAIVGKNGNDEAVGYFGEKIVLQAQALGVNSCWVAMSYSRGKVPCKLDKGEKLYIVIALGYGVTQGVLHKSKPMEALCKAEEPMPEWFKIGMEAAMLAPTAINQQKFTITLLGAKVQAKAGIGYYSKMDLGIVKYHFEAAAGTQNFRWA